MLGIIYCLARLWLVAVLADMRKAAMALLRRYVGAWRKRGVLGSITQGYRDICSLRDLLWRFWAARRPKPATGALPRDTEPPCGCGGE